MTKKIKKKKNNRIKKIRINNKTKIKIKKYNKKKYKRQLINNKTKYI